MVLSNEDSSGVLKILLERVISTSGMSFLLMLTPFLSVNRNLFFNLYYYIIRILKSGVSTLDFLVSPWILFKYLKIALDAKRQTFATIYKWKNRLLLLCKIYTWKCLQKKLVQNDGGFFDVENVSHAVKDYFILTWLVQE